MLVLYESVVDYFIENPNPNPRKLAYNASVEMQNCELRAKNLNTNKLLPLVIDLDGTLIKSDILIESCFLALRLNPLLIFMFPFWLAYGKANLKQEVAKRVEVDVFSLPYNQELLDYIYEQKGRGRVIVLATASVEKYAVQIANHLKVFDLVLASNQSVNLSGQNKRAILEQHFGCKGFVYAGNANVDMSVWPAAVSAVVVNPSPGLVNKVENNFLIEKIINHKTNLFVNIMKASRVYQWVKNLLVFVPILLSHEVSNPSAWWHGFIAFISFSLCASAVYMLNDLVDLPDDRKHETKFKRPFASGDLSPVLGVVAIPLFLFMSLLLACFLPIKFLICLFCYFSFTLLYSFWLKRKVLIDVISLASLYTARIIAGVFAANLFLSFWLLSFSMFLFLSLAIIKRYSELLKLKNKGEASIQGRGYESNDVELLASLGGSSGYVAVLVLALYLNSTEVKEQYATPEFLWLMCPVVLYWISRAWIIAHRGLMHDDPIVWAVRDKLSLLAGVLLIIVALFAK